MDKLTRFSLPNTPFRFSFKRPLVNISLQLDLTKNFIVSGSVSEFKICTLIPLTCGPPFLWFQSFYRGCFPSFRFRYTRSYDSTCWRSCRYRRSSRRWVLTVNCVYFFNVKFRNLDTTKLFVWIVFPDESLFAIF